MDSFFTLAQIVIFIWIIGSFFAARSEKEQIKERQASLLDTKRDHPLSTSEISAIKQIYDQEVEPQDVFYVTGKFELNVVKGETEEDETMFLSFGDFLVVMPEIAYSYLHLDNNFAEVIVADDFLIILSLNDYTLLDEVNGLLTIDSWQDYKKEEHNHPLCNEDVAELGKAALRDTHENTASLTDSQDSAPITTVTYKSQRQANELEIRYLAPPFYNWIVPLLLVLVGILFFHFTTLDVTLTASWIAPALLFVICCAILLLLKRHGPSSHADSLLVKQYFGTIERIDHEDNRDWVVFTSPTGLTQKAWLPREWQAKVPLNRSVRFEIEESHSALTSIGSQQITDSDVTKKKPQYLTSLIGLLTVVFIVMINTELEWREASIAMLQGERSHQIHAVQDWPLINNVKPGDHISIQQPRLCLQTLNTRTNTTVYCQQFQYSTINQAFINNQALKIIKRYRDFVVLAPDYTPELPEGLYDYMVSVAKIQKMASADGFRQRIRQRSEMVLFTVSDLNGIATHIEPFCSSTSQAMAENDSAQLACTSFKAALSALWQSATEETCEPDCWQEILRGDPNEDNSTIEVADDLGGYLAALSDLETAAWKHTKAVLFASELDSPYVHIHWTGPQEDRLKAITSLRAALESGSREEQIDKLKQLWQAQVEAAYKRVSATVLNIDKSEKNIIITLAPPLSQKQAMETVLNLALLAALSLLIIIVLIAYLRSGRHRKAKPLQSEDAWIS
ncbi:hypothetical protein [Vibrio renipiscarius]|uniref:Intracellular growth attenuator protein igaA n=1 Tax=Vibrio renipiscarius TaxID=1461322 RepID=A0A0C2JLB9_9VIBR|nr:hypothetical protein [Vibrio renipiscarius]KII75406.1 hypothetical protein OJ16_19190 [Vibrio renipiscarius]KII78859.1 hypothetical protein PL18_11300 [Vibrio renipiscarius]